MSDHELPTVTTKDAVCHIDFEFQMPYHEPLTSKELLKECIASATTEVLSTNLTLSMDNIKIPEIDLRPIDKPKRIKVGGWITCPDNQRQIYVEALELAQRSRKISKQIVSRTSIKRTKIQIQQFITRFSNAHHVNKSFIDSTEKPFQKFKKRSTSLNNASPSPSPPTTGLYAGSESVIVHPDHVIEAKINEEEQSTNENDSSFQMVDALHDDDDDDADADDDQSSNEEHKSPLDTDNDIIEVPLEDYASITPIISAAVHVEDETDELLKLKLEVQHLKQSHKNDLYHFQNKISLLKKERTIERQRSRISEQIDDDILQKQIKQQTDDKVMELEMEMAVQQKEQSLSFQELQLVHAKEMQKFNYKMRQTQELHTLEVSNIRSQHKYQTEQLQAQLRGLTGALERESQKDRKIFALSEDNEQLKFEKDKIITNYDAAIENLNNDSEASIKQEINRRIKETAAFKREINDIKQKMQRENKIKNRLERQVEQLQNEIESKDSVISQMRDMFLKEKKKANILERKVLRNKSKRNINIQLQENKDKEILNKGGHLRKTSKTLKNVIIEMEKNQETGDVIFTLEKTDDPLDIFANMNMPFEDESDDEDDDNYKSDDEKENNNQEIALKEQQIQTLRGKINNLEGLVSTIKDEKNIELQVLQQKIGSLQQQIEIADESFLKQNGMLEFKLNKKENDNKKLAEDLQELKRLHRKEISSLMNEIKKAKQEIMDAERTVENLGQHLDMMQEENARLKENDEIIADYEEEMDEIDKHYQDLLDGLKKQNEETEIQFKGLVQQREEENKTLKTTVHRQSISILELQSLLKDMKSAEVELEMEDVDVDIDIVKEETRNSRGSVELSENDLIDAWRGQAQVDAPQPDAPSPQIDIDVDVVEEQEDVEVNMDIYMLREDMKDIIENRENEWNEESKMKHALHIDTIESKYKQKYQNMEGKLNENIKLLTQNNNDLVNELGELNSNKNEINRLQTQLTNVENDKIRLLHSFMSEMDRMRDAIKKLNVSK